MQHKKLKQSYFVTQFRHRHVNTQLWLTAAQQKIKLRGKNTVENVIEIER